MNARNKFLILLGVILAITAAYYYFSTPHGNDLVLVGTVDANQIVVSPQIQGRISKLLVDEGTPVKQGDLIAVLDPSELEAEERAATATIASMRSQVSANEYTQRSTKGSTTSDVANAQAQLQASRAQLAQAEAMLTRIESDSRRTIGLANAGVASEQEKVQAEQNLKAQQASVDSLKQQVSAAQASLDASVARTNQATAAASTVASTRAQMENAMAQLKEAEVRLGYTKIYAPVTGTVLVRAAREGEVVNAGQAIVTVVDFSDTWVRAAIPETNADHIGYGDTLKIRLPGGTEVPGKVFYKAAEADFATQRDVGRRKRDIRTLLLKVRLDNPKGAYVPGMTAEVLVSQAQLKGTAVAENAGSTGK
ncbi:MAG TPA: efflux RND transporter periplasmic adaptor subunit [Terriglobales bacterium]|nr:efflux RND transporter periplasmic adaptor subunit [Terriglobales bacterium]